MSFLPKKINIRRNHDNSFKKKKNNIISKIIRDVFVFIKNIRGSQSKFSLRINT